MGKGEEVNDDQTRSDYNYSFGKSYLVQTPFR